MAQGEGHDALLEERRQLVGHARRAAFPRPRDLQAVALDEGLPAVAARAVVAELAAGARDADPLGAGGQADAVAEGQVIIGHESGPPPERSDARRMGRFRCLLPRSDLSGRLGGGAG